MKRFVIAAAALLTLVGPMAATAASAQPYNQSQQNNRGPQNNNDQRRNWDQSRDNGYFVGNTFHRGAPPAAVQRRADFRPGWQSWRRGERLSSYQRQHYAQVDYRTAHLRAPPRGYHYVRDDRGEVLLVAVATGLIASILASQ